ncbi:hypothetical protein D3C81_2065860 [compost metagenome]
MFLRRVVEYCAAVACGIHVRRTGSHIFINDNRTVIQHFNLTLKQRRIRTEADAQYNEICFIFSLVCHHFTDFIFAFKTNDLFSKRKFNPVILKGIFNFIRILCI